MNFEDERSIEEVNELVAAVSHHQRREILKILRTSDRPLALADLAIELVRHLEEISDETEAKRQAEQRQIELYHRHIPKLVDVGLVEYDPALKTVEATEKATDIDALAVETRIPAFGL